MVRVISQFERISGYAIKELGGLPHIHKLLLGHITHHFLEYEFAGADSSLGMVELDPAGVVGREDEDEESPPRR